MRKHNQRGPLYRAALILLVFLIFTPLAHASEAVETGGGSPRYLALTFDDGPSGKVTEYLLDGLRSRGVKATFFLCGYRMELYPSLVAQMAEDGHELAVHGFTHRYLHTMEPEDVLDELTEASELITELTGLTARTFRPPGGLYNDDVLTAVEQSELSVVLWNIDTYDWRDTDAATVARRIVSRAESGDVVLLHDMHRHSADAAFRAIDTLVAQGWEFVTLTELAELTGQPLVPGQVFQLARK